VAISTYRTTTVTSRARTTRSTRERPFTLRHASFIPHVPADSLSSLRYRSIDALLGERPGPALPQCECRVCHAPCRCDLARERVYCHSPVRHRRGIRQRQATTAALFDRHSVSSSERHAGPAAGMRRSPSRPARSSLADARFTVRGRPAEGASSAAPARFHFRDRPRRGPSRIRRNRANRSGKALVPSV
jgi:hypothetical protein